MCKGRHGIDILDYIGTQYGEEVFRAYGMEFKMLHLSEECAELYVELSHASRVDRGGDCAAVQEELIDVLILTDEISVTLDKGHIKDEMNFLGRQNRTGVSVAQVRISLAQLILYCEKYLSCKKTFSEIQKKVEKCAALVLLYIEQYYALREDLFELWRAKKLEKVEKKLVEWRKK